MKSDAPAPRALGYRNETVFRSAERLLASQPVSSKRRWPARWLIFLLGLACGLTVAVWWQLGNERQRANSGVPVGTLPQNVRPAPEGSANRSPLRRSLPPVTDGKDAAPLDGPRAATLAESSAVSPRAARSSTTAPSAAARRESAKRLEIAGTLIDEPFIWLVGELRDGSGRRARRVAFWVNFFPDFTEVHAEMKLPDTPAWPTVNLVGTCDLKSIHVHEQFDPAGYDITVQFPVTVDAKFEGEWKDPHSRVDSGGTLTLEMVRQNRGRRR